MGRCGRGGGARLAWPVLLAGRAACSMASRRTDWWSWFGPVRATGPGSVLQPSSNRTNRLNLPSQPPTAVQELDLEYELQLKDHLVPMLHGVDCTPSYFIVGGLVFMPLTQARPVHLIIRPVHLLITIVTVLSLPLSLVLAGLCPVLAHAFTFCFSSRVWCLGIRPPPCSTLRFRV